MMKLKLAISERSNTQDTNMILSDDYHDDDTGIAHIMRLTNASNVQCW
jgi:hypothetical protein